MNSFGELGMTTIRKMNTIGEGNQELRRMESSFWFKHPNKFLSNSITDIFINLEGIDKYMAEYICCSYHGV